MIVKTDTSTSIDIKYLNASYHPEILDMNMKTRYDFKDSLKYELIDSTSFKLVIPKKSTALIGLPYGWFSRDYSVCFKQQNGKIDTLGKTINYKLINKKGEDIITARPLRKQILYIDVK